ncbi:MAG TPA: hypothetical protein VGB64_15120 [Actinomycetota bacterium]
MRPVAVPTSVVSALAVAIAALLTAGTPIAIRHASTNAAGGSDIVPSARDGIEVVIAPRSAGSRSDRAETRRPAEAVAGPAVTDPATTPMAATAAPFTLELPDGWSGGEIGAFDDDAKRSFRYTDEAGRYFVVNIDPAGSEFDADEVWRYRVEDHERFVVTRQERCVPSEPMCSLGDGAQTIYALWDEGGSARVGGHAYYFRFGDEHNEIGGTRVFRQILESIRARA